MVLGFILKDESLVLFDPQAHMSVHVTVCDSVADGVALQD
jgi:hypothetical protein